MIKKKLRLNSENFRLRHPYFIDTPCFSVRFRPNQLAHNRFGVIISSKIDKRATERNYFRRRLLDGTSNWPNLGLDLIFVAKPKIREATPREIKVELNQALLALKKPKTITP